MKIAIMQPYVFPYIGYFQLIKAVDLFVFYDDVNFIKKGFINRNSILVNNKRFNFTIPCKEVSQHKKINKTEVFFDAKAQQKFLNTISQAYGKAPYFEDVYPLLEHLFMKSNYHTIADLAMKSVYLVSEYLGVTTKFKVSSYCFSETEHLVKEDRLIQISKNVGATTYVNAIGGQELYDPISFKVRGVDLKFLKTGTICYEQWSKEFEANLSIIDVMMFNSRDDINDFLEMYSLI
ncbi:WbqC family protein [Mangrovimonas sp. TPBH4]|uniref:WbqC family protein n=1 Tax=Mangrovimonas sp. TPBH4 TaxID=1645914 RepID=UPI0006B54F69|nr:WbqC family protein [Mangrovimonas sp. TPBH4]